MHRAPFGKITGQRTPLAACAQQVQHRAEHLVQIYGGGFGLATCLFQQRLDLLKLISSDVAGVLLFSHPDILSRSLEKDREHALRKIFEPHLGRFELESDGPAFMQDFQLPAEVNRLPVLDLLIDAGSGSNQYFNKPASDHAMCRSCAAQALFTLQINAPAGGRGVRTSLRGGGPLTSLL